MAKPGLTKKVKRQYYNILNKASEENCFWPHPKAATGWYNSRTPIPNSVYAWQSYLFAKRWHSRAEVDIRRLENIVRESKDGECAYRFAKDVPGANMRKLQRAVVMAGDPEWIKKFARHVPGANAEYLESVLMIAEVMGI